MKIHKKIDLSADTDALLVEGPAILETSRGIRYVYNVRTRMEYIQGKGLVQILLVSGDDRVLEYILDAPTKTNTEEGVVEFSSMKTRYKIREIQDSDNKALIEVAVPTPAKEKN
jgi:hypothetical protein